MEFCVLDICSELFDTKETCIFVCNSQVLRFPLPIGLSISVLSLVSSYALTFWKSQPLCNRFVSPVSMSSARSWLNTSSTIESMFWEIRAVGLHFTIAGFAIHSSTVPFDHSSDSSATPSHLAWFGVAGELPEGPPVHEKCRRPKIWPKMTKSNHGNVHVTAPGQRESRTQKKFKGGWRP